MKNKWGTAARCAKKLVDAYVFVPFGDSAWQSLASVTRDNAEGIARDAYIAGYTAGQRNRKKRQV